MSWLGSACAARATNVSPVATPSSPRTDATSVAAPSSHTDATSVVASSSSVRIDADPSRLAWMEGRWIGSDNGEDMLEEWTSTAGGALLGMHKDVKAGRMTSFEFLRIQTTTSDGLVYFASPRSAPVTPFAAIELDEKRVVFENKAHDFPQRVIYWLDGEGAMHARIEGTVRGTMRSKEWRWTKP